ncbi:MAG: DUF1847 domain-containing protein [Chlorobiaceae bacterium]|nr:DUF1847 domain-containing protein [Chlorobiaceae bacterium]NTV26913.1 DUF1847 domain-containing protein [Chlorobiaceae bacterium]
MNPDHHHSDMSCTECGFLNCYRRDKRFPDFCPGEAVPDGALAEALRQCCDDGPDSRAAGAAAEVEGRFYSKLTRVEETVEFARRLGAKKIGIATCVGLIEETRIFSRILKSNGFEHHAVLCKIGSIDKTEAGISDELKIQPGCFEAMCNPILQARMLNEWGADLNVVIGLCVGHDALFSKHSSALVTTMVVKDRVLAHNPAAALYTAGSYYKKIMTPREGM